MKEEIVLDNSVKTIEKIEEKTEISSEQKSELITEKVEPLPKKNNGQNEWKK